MEIYSLCHDKENVTIYLGKKRSFLLSFLFKQQNEETFLLISYTSKYDIGPDHLLALRIGISNRLLSPRT